MLPRIQIIWAACRIGLGLTDWLKEQGHGLFVTDDKEGDDSDHIDLKAAANAGLTVAEVTGSNVVSVAEDEVMRILFLLRNILPAWQQIHDGGYSRDVCYPQPPPSDHPWRTMKNGAMTPHLSGTTIDAQASRIWFLKSTFTSVQQRYSAGIKEMLQCCFEGKPFQEDYYIVREGELAPQYQ
eukprot:SM000012S25426  [mRNA]  locus=s12:990056:992035:+ [translate_table: standard]